MTRVGAVLRGEALRPGRGARRRAERKAEREAQRATEREAARGAERTAGSAVATDPGHRANPGRLDGHVHPTFAPVAAMLQKQVDATAGGAALCVYFRGRCVVDLWGGRRDRDGRPWLRDTMAPSFSTTKGVASTLAHIAADRGLIDYEAPVANYWPEFAQAGKADVTVRHVLSHQSGLYHIRQLIDDAHRMRDWDYMVNALACATPAHAPGARTGYHGLTYGFLVGEILQRVTGRDFATLVHEELSEPLGLDGLYVGAPSEAIDRSAELMWSAGSRGSKRPLPDLNVQIASAVLGGGSSFLHAVSRMVGHEVDLASLLDALVPRGMAGFDFGAPETLSVPIPAANGLFTARSLARMYAVLANGGEMDGVRLMSRDTLEHATTVQKAPSRRAVLPVDMRWRLGYHGIPTTRGFIDSGFGHFGFGGSGAFADPSRELSVAMVVNSGIGTPLGDLRIARLGTAIVRCAGAPRTQPARSGLRVIPRLARAVAGLVVPPA